MTRWGQFVAMGMPQLTGRCSLRDIVSNLAAQSCKLYHLGVGVVTRSSLARVNAEKPWEMYEELHGRLLGRCQAKAPGHGYRFKAKLFSVDSTTIDLCLSAFPWAKFRRTKGAVKVHVGLGIVPCGVELREWQLPFPLRGGPCYATSATKQSGGSSASNAQTKCRRSR